MKKQERGYARVYDIPSDWRLGFLPHERIRDFFGASARLGHAVMTRLYRMGEELGGTKAHGTKFGTASEI